MSIPEKHPAVQKAIAYYRKKGLGAVRDDSLPYTLIGAHNEFITDDNCEAPPMLLVCKTCSTPDFHVGINDNQIIIQCPKCEWVYTIYDNQ